MAKIGDKIRFLNAVGGGKIIKIEGKIATVLEDDGFETPVLLSEIVVIPEVNELNFPIKPRIVEEISAPKKEEKKIDTNAFLEKFKKEEPKQNFNKQKNLTLEIDLHCHALIENKSGMTNGEILQIQIAEFEKQMRENLNKKGKKIIFIHGKGTGVLRREIENLLKTKYKNCYFQDASFREYGFGATQVTIK